MKKIIPVTLTLLLLFFAGTAAAHRGHDRSDLNSDSSQGERVDRRLDSKGNRIEQHFDHKAARAAEQGKYRLAHKFQQKGDRINRHLDRKGDRLHARLDLRGHKPSVRHDKDRFYKCSDAPVPNHRYDHRDHQQRW